MAMGWKHLHRGGNLLMGKEKKITTGRRQPKVFEG
jgi:hypothetical protein